MGIYLLFGTLLVGGWAIYLLRDQSEEETIKSIDIRKRIHQTQQFSSINLLRKRLNDITTEKVSYTKRSHKELIYLQAGFKFRYSDHILLGVVSGIVFSLLMSLLLKNPYASPIFLIIGYGIPFQVIRAIRNRRIALLDKQVGIFLKMILKRYEVTDDFGKAFRYVADEMKNEAPINLDLEACVRMIDLGTPMIEVLEHLAERTSNKFISRLAEYYRIVSAIGTREAKENLLQQAYIQYEENRQVQRTLQEKLSEPVRECYIILGMVPIMALYQAVTSEDYIQFMTGTQIGKIGTTAVISVCFILTWFINTKIGGPID